jgi:hypothetical protein
MRKDHGHTVKTALGNVAALEARQLDLCYRPQPFTSESQRAEYLFALYEKLIARLLPTIKPAASKSQA